MLFFLLLLRAETSTETKSRLEKRKMALAEESHQQRAATLECMSALKQHKKQHLAAEMPEERESYQAGVAT